MNLTIIAGPIIGAAIGYVTNYIAVKMLFRPLHPVKIGEHTLLFTPGIIPKEKPRLARAIGTIVGQQLVNRDVLEKALLSEPMKASIRNSVNQKIDNMSQETSFSDLIASLIPNIKISELRDSLSQKLTLQIKESLLNSDIGSLLSKEIVKSIKSHLQGGFLALMINDSLLNTIGEYIASGITDYVKDNGEELLYPYISQELDNSLNKKAVELVYLLRKNNIEPENIIMSGYEKLVSNELEHFLNNLNISQLVEQEINNMDVMELEKLLLTVMKKELNAIVNLGALIGFILGLINLII